MTGQRVPPEEMSSFPWSRVLRGSGCWEWTGALTNKGYGHYARNGRDIVASRGAWEEANGPIPDGLWVLHHCDNPKCVKTEPDASYPNGHLYLGTQKENMRDAALRGRTASGARSGAVLHPESVLRGSQRKTAKLAESDIPLIRAYLADGWDFTMVALFFGVTPTVIGRIARGTAWTHV